MLNDAPPWTRSLLTTNWAAIAASTTELWMPLEAPGSTPRKRLVDALGCGHYGCVFETNTPDVVMKISSDPSEAEFIKMAVKIGRWPDGIVKYHAILDLPGAYKRRPVFVIWREAAFDVGEIGQGPDPHAQHEFDRYHEAYMNAARAVRDTSKRSDSWPKLLSEARSHWHEWAWKNTTWEDGEGRYKGTPRPPEFMRYRGAQRLAAALRICEICFELMEHTNYAPDVGAALKWYLDLGLLLADVHRGNIGRVMRDEGYGPEPRIVITDPGHAVLVGTGS